LGSFSLDAVGRCRKFTPEEVDLCQVFAAHVAVAVENARLFSQSSEAKKWQEALVESAFDAVVAIDQHKKIMVFNQRAEEMFGREAEEMMGHTTARLHTDVGRARDVFEAVNRDGAITGWDVELKHRDGTRIPALLSATLIQGRDGRSIGQAGFMRDLRRVNLLEERQRALIQVARAVTSVLELDKVLERVIQSAVAAFPKAQHGTIHLYDERTDALCLQANTFGYSPSAVEALRLRPGEGIAGWVFQHRQPLILDDARQDPRYKQVDHPEALVHKSLVCVPLQVRGRVIGTLSLDNLDVIGAFHADDLGLLSSFADQAAIAIDNARLYHETDRRQQLLAALDEASRHIQAEKETSKLLHEVVGLAAQLAGCSAGGLFVNRPHLEELELRVTYDLPTELVGSRLSHTQGLAGLVARTGRPQIVYQYSGWHDHEAIFEPYHFAVAAAVPLKQAGEVEAVLFVADAADSQRLAQTDLEILERFAAQAAIALQTSRLMSREQRMFRQMGILHQISDYIQASRDLDKILHVVLTGVTAGYGLGFNRAALLLLDERREYLVGRMGIGHLEESAAERDWVQHHEKGLEDFRRYLELLEQDGLPPTPVGERVRGVRLPVVSAACDLFLRVIRERQCHLVTRDELEGLPPGFVEAFGPALPLVIAPLIARGQTIGLLVADNKFTESPVTPEDEEALLTFANTAAIAIENHQLYREASAGRERLRSFYAASNALVSSQDLEQVLYDIVEQARVAAQARSVSMVLIERPGQVRQLVTAGEEETVDTKDLVRKDGLSMQVMCTGRPAIIEDAAAQRDRVNPTMFQRRISAALGLPIVLKGEQFGVMWFHYGEPRRFSPSEIEAVQLYVNQAALAYDSARRIKELEHMRQAAEALAGVASLQKVLEEIVQSARDVLEADSAAIWSYDDVRDRFIPESSVSSGISAELWEEFRQEETRRGGTAYMVIEQGWIGVNDVADPERCGLLGESTRRLLGQTGIRSFQGIALTVGGQKLGVLYVNYNGPRDFYEREQEIVRTFANHAALAMNKARLLEQVSKAQNAAKVVAQVAVLGDREATLASVAQGTREAADCDAVTLFVCDQATNRLDHPPTMVGVRYPDRASLYGRVLTDSIVYEMLRRDGPYIAETIAQDALFRGRLFAKDEEIASCVAIPLRAVGQEVGVMFVNYRTHHRFTADELANIELFANQAAVAIHNSRLYQAEQQHGQALKAIQATSAAVSAVLDLDVLFPMITEEAAAIFKAPATSLMLWDERQENLVIRAAFGLGAEYRQRQRIARSRADKLIKARGLGPQVLDVHSEPIGEAELVHSEKLYTMLAAPLTIGGELIGILSIYSRGEPRQFQEREQELARIFANHAAIAIHNAQLYREATKRLEESQALQRVAISLAGTLELEEVLHVVMTAALDLSEMESGRIVFWDPQQEMFTQTLTTVGPDRTLQLTPGSAEQGGVGRAVVDEGKPIVIPDTRKDSRVKSGVFERGQRALICVPLVSREETIGALYVSSSEPYQFSRRQVAMLESLAGQASMAIERTRQYQELKRAKGLVGARTAMAWMGMAGSAWRHAIDKHALTIREQVQLLRRDWERVPSHTQDAKASERIATIERLATQILDKPITPPLSTEAGLEKVPLNALIGERARQLWQNAPYDKAELRLDLQLPESAIVKANPEWLRRALDILVDNAVDAVVDCEVREIAVGTQAAYGGAQVLVSDTGPGIPEELQAKLGLEFIEKPEDARGLGMGLLIAHAIVQTYGGEIRVDSTGPTGTTMVIWLPLDV
jgi:PAS domain S-box-containing protein